MFTSYITYALPYRIYATDSGINNKNGIMLRKDQARANTTFEHPTNTCPDLFLKLKNWPKVPQMPF
jgi:hypothetical protein